MVLSGQEIEELSGFDLSHCLGDEDFEHFLDVVELEIQFFRVDYQELDHVDEDSNSLSVLDILIHG